MESQKKPVMLMILDGWGLPQGGPGDALSKAKLPNFDRLNKEYPHTILQTSGGAVGLPAGQMGNSEVGHLNIGAGRIVYQDITFISKSIADGSLEQNPVIAAAFDKAKARGNAVHFMGLLSDGGVHSHIDHLFALLAMAKRRGLNKIFVHCFLDGRDTPPKSGLGYVQKLDDYLKELNCGQIATITGRYYAMDRDKRWERIELAYRAMVWGEGTQVSTAEEAVQRSYDEGITDEFMQPAVVYADGEPIGNICDGDSVIFYNFRADRAREITSAFVAQEFNFFDRGYLPPATNFVCMTSYDETIQAPVAFGKRNLEHILSQVLAEHGKTQFRIAETEKYAHITFFFNGRVEPPYEGEERLLIPSPKVATYDLQPEMSARKVTDALLAKIAENKYDFYLINFANPDMVGHTGKFAAAVQAVEFVDGCLGEIVQAVQEKQGSVLIIADHGNVEQMINENGEPHTAHTVNDVPCILISETYKNYLLREYGSLQDVAPTILQLMQIEKPQEMTGQSLIDREI